MLKHHAAEYSFVRLAIALPLLFCLQACDEKVEVSLERIALLPDKSGYLAKVIRTWEKTNIEMALIEVRESGKKEIFVISSQNLDGIEFRSKTRNDTIYLFHFQPGLDKNVTGIQGPSFPVKFEYAETGKWLTSGLLEDDPLFYAKEKWDLILKMMEKE